MTAASEARRIALMLNDSKWQEIEEEIRKAIETADRRAHAESFRWMDQNCYGPPSVEHFCRRGGIVKGSDVGCCAGLPDPLFAARDEPAIVWPYTDEQLGRDIVRVQTAIERWRDQPDGVR